MWGYKQIKKNIKEDLTREEILQRRVKQNRDKFCWY